MPISGWVLVVLSWIVICAVCLFVHINASKKLTSVIAIVVAIILCFGAYFVGNWYYTSTAAGRRMSLDEKSNFSNGLGRTITVYTADGHVIAKYHGKIDIESEQSYVKFDFDGKRYIYYNCFVETIAEIP